jgi:CubicO group peptidase (beta-lactamase class C family)
LEWYEIGNYSEFNEWVSSPDQINYILAKPFVTVPGTYFNYSDGAAHLSSVILEEAARMSIVDFANQYLFGQLGLGQKSWLADNRGYNFGGAGLHITPRDMIKFGRLYLNKGIYNGQQIIPENWIDESTAIHIPTNNAVPYGPNYGYYWWMINECGHYIFYAMGYGGQFIFCVPDLNLVTAATCNWQNTGGQADEYWYTIISLFMNNIIPAVN